jgi:RimJ/RimL family protein N-acetyltransferase
MVPGAYWQRIRRAHREGGWALVVRKLGSKLCCEVVLYAFDLGHDIADTATAGQLEVRPLSATDLEAYLALRDDEDYATVNARLRRGDLCFASWSGDQLVGGAWVRFDRIWISELGKGLSLTPREVFGYASFTNRHYRRQGAATVRAEATIHHLQGLGYQRIVAYVLRENLASRRSLDKLGFEPEGRIRWFHLGRIGIERSTGTGSTTCVRIHVRPRNPHE